MFRCLYQISKLKSFLIPSQAGRLYHMFAHVCMCLERENGVALI